MSLEEMIARTFDRINDYREYFYRRAIEIHHNTDMQMIAEKCGPVMVYTQAHGGMTVQYSAAGFVADIGKNRWTNGRRAWDSNIVDCIVRDNRLYAGEEHLLELFPDLKISAIERALEKTVLRYQRIYTGERQ